MTLGKVQLAESKIYKINAAAFTDMEQTYS